MRGGSAAWILLRRDTTPFVHRSQHLLLQPAAAAEPASMPRCIETQAVMKDHGGGELFRLLYLFSAVLRDNFFVCRCITCAIPACP
jgi:hypothetical protein